MILSRTFSSPATCCCCTTRLFPDALPIFTDSQYNHVPRSDYTFLVFRRDWLQLRRLTLHLVSNLQGDKMWEFIIPLVLIAIAPNTLIPAALFGLVTTLVRVLFGTSIGHQIDVRGRLTSALLLCNFHPAFACCFFFVFFLLFFFFFFGFEIVFLSVVVIRWGIGVQALSVACSALLLEFFLRIANPQMADNIFYSAEPTGLLVALLISAAVGSLAAQVR